MAERDFSYFVLLEIFGELEISLNVRDKESFLNKEYCEENLGGETCKVSELFIPC